MRYVQALTHMKKMTNNSSIISECYNRLINYTGGPMRVLGGHATDMFYIPATLLVKWVTVAEVKNQFHLLVYLCPKNYFIMPFDA